MKSCGSFTRVANIPDLTHEKGADIAADPFGFVYLGKSVAAHFAAANFTAQRRACACTDQRAEQIRSAATDLVADQPADRRADNQPGGTVVAPAIIAPVVAGIVVLIISIGFLFLFLREVYNIKMVSVAEESSRRDFTAPATQQKGISEK